MTVLRINDIYMTSANFMLPVVKKRLTISSVARLQRM